MIYTCCLLLLFCILIHTHTLSQRTISISLHWFTVRTFYYFQYSIIVFFLLQQMRNLCTCRAAGECNKNATCKSPHFVINPIYIRKCACILIYVCTNIRMWSLVCSCTHTCVFVCVLVSVSLCAKVTAILLPLPQRIYP